MPPPPFRLFGPDHLAALAATAGLCLLFGPGVRRLPPAGREWARWALILLLIGYILGEIPARAELGARSWTRYVPLNISDWMLFACLAALVTRRPLPFEIAYYWGLALGLPTLLTPDLRVGFPAFPYFHFFWGHGAVLVGLAYLIAAEGLRPRRGSPWRAFGAANVYLLAAALFDWLTGANYGYVRHAPPRGTLLNYLGPWPWYLLAVEGLALGGFWLLYLPWLPLAVGGAGMRQGRGRLTGACVKTPPEEEHGNRIP